MTGEKVLKPWGWYQDLIRLPHTTSKVIELDPGTQFSLQSHEARVEYWFHMYGEPMVILGHTNNAVPLLPGHCFLIERHQIHRLKNLSVTEPCRILEVQVGHCSEEDIKRYEDDFGRA